MAKINIIPLLSTGILLHVALAAILNEPMAPEPFDDLEIQQVSDSDETCTTVSDLNSINNGIIDTKYRWKNFYVQPDKIYTRRERQMISQAMYNLQQVLPCVNFGIWSPESTPTGDYIRIYNGTGCSSIIGRQGGMQNMSLKTPGCVGRGCSGCMSVGTMMHEMIHALGVDHEHNRPDRDDYVTIHIDNCQKGHEFNFNKTSASKFSTYGIPYNQRSIMHYDNYAFSKQPNVLQTIVAKNGRPVGSRGRLEQTDIQKLKKMYEC